MAAPVGVNNSPGVASVTGRSAARTAFDLAEKGGRRGRRNRQQTVLSLDIPGTDSKRSNPDLLDSEHLHRDGGATEIDDRIDRTDFVKMDILDRNVVDTSLGFGENAEPSQRQRFGDVRHAPNQ